MVYPTGVSCIVFTALIHEWQGRRQGLDRWHRDCSSSFQPETAFDQHTMDGHGSHPSQFPLAAQL